MKKSQDIKPEMLKILCFNPILLEKFIINLTYCERNKENKIDFAFVWALRVDILKKNKLLMYEMNFIIKNMKK